jgi:hypothetical protein
MKEEGRSSAPDGGHPTLTGAEKALTRLDPASPGFHRRQSFGGRVGLASGG